MISPSRSAVRSSYVSLKIITIGALTQAPRHSTSSHESVPLSLRWNGCSWIFSRQTRFRSSEPRSMHGVVPHT